MRNFLNNVTYNADDYTTSQINEYAPITVDSNNYKPLGITVDGITYYNQEPNVKYNIGNGSIEPLDRLRYIRVNAPNVRDLGGWACDGGTVKYGLLFRGGQPREADRAVFVEELGIMHDLDLRGTTEAGLTQSPLGEDIYYTCARDYNWYGLTNKTAWKTNLKCVFDAIAHKEPILFHCSAGADRTGTLACVLEGLLGMSQSDIDKDYELTCFYTGTGTDLLARRRNEQEWQNLINEINKKVGSTFRDKCVTFAVELGFTLEEINAYRKQMINGTPELVTASIAKYTISSTLNNVSSSNSATTINQYQGYTATIMPSPDCVIDSVSIKMNGKDVTSFYWSGSETNLTRSVKFNFTGCYGNNNNKSIIDGQSYVNSITAKVGYTLDEASISIMMGDIDMSTYYKNGTIAIPQVTGNLEITITAVGITQENYLNLDRTYEAKAAGVLLGSVLDDTKAYTNIQYSEDKFRDPSIYTCAYKDVTENSVTVTEAGGGGTAIGYPIHLPDLATQVYTLSFEYSGAGKLRVYYRFYDDAGNYSSVTNITDEVVGGTGIKSVTINATGTSYTWLVVEFGANTKNTKSYTNVSLKKTI